MVLVEEVASAVSNEVVGIPPLRRIPAICSGLLPVGGRAGVDGFRRQTSRQAGVFDDLIVFDSAGSVCDGMRWAIRSPQWQTRRCLLS
jgi:hypothetical protein